MKHPLTSKERRGLVAVAAAALLCIAAGPLMRACGNTRTEINPKIESYQQEKADNSDKSDKSIKSKQSRQSKNSKKTSKSKTKKAIPVRSPLDQPCD